MINTQVTPSSLPPFLWGVATSGYQSEGGYNGPGQPQNNWSWSEADGTVMPTGTAAEFWSRYQDDFQICQHMGLNAFRLSLEWARIQPTHVAQVGQAPEFDLAALDAYVERLAACMFAGLEPVVTLHHFTHPAWLGLDPWLSVSTLDRFATYVRTTITHINRGLTEVYQLPPLSWYITINEPNILVLNSYFGKQFPSGSTLGQAAVLQAYNLLLAAHVRAYNIIYDIYEAEGWSTPNVSLNTYCSDLYWSDKVLWDLLHCPQHQVRERSLRPYITAKAEHHETTLAQANLPFQEDLPYRVGRWGRKLANWVGERRFDPHAFHTFLQELEYSPRDSVCDFVGLDYYDPFIAHTLRLPSFSDFEFKTKGLRAWLMSGITSKWWNWRSLPEGLHFFCQTYAQDLEQPILIAENGMALRRKPDNSVATPRPDQLHRSQFLRAHIAQVRRLLQEGVPILGYLYWSLTDNYEWGSYTPRFGLLSIDFDAGTERLWQDHLGDRPLETYAQLVQIATGEIPDDNPKLNLQSLS
ncbi:MAG: glycoside hydrolase family 1 protein [Synechococcaceae cyanobacterium SM2_3_1]|nr:glycoside hydrolase family 1 protein [Synechococcaceae cyanobacterium SM2_3_1]